MKIRSLSNLFRSEPSAGGASPKLVTRHSSLVTAVAALVFAALAAETAAAGAFSYQGVLCDASGNPLSGEKTLELRLYTSETGGAAGWGRAYAVTPEAGGLFAVTASDAAGDAISGVPSGNLDAFFAANAANTVFVGVTVRGGSEIAPRQRLVPVPYAGFALDAASSSGDFTAAGRVSARTLAVSGNASFSAPLSVSGDATVKGNLAVSGALSGYGSVPAGTIILWNGGTGDIPEGWALCNGQSVNGWKTPDLRDRFVAGAGDRYAVGAKGGEKMHRLTVEEMPSHAHEVYGRSSGYEAAHNDSHEVITYANKPWGSWSEKINDTTSAGSGWAHENRPPYHALCYIMRVK